MLEDVARELLWTRTMRTPALAIRPSRVVFGMAAALLATVIGSIPLGDPDQPTVAERISGAISDVFTDATASILALDPAGFASAVTDLALFPGALIQDRPWATVLLGIPMLIAIALFGGAIARAAAVQFTSARYSDWPTDLRVSLRSLGASIASLIAPLALVGVIVLVIATAGVLLGVPVLDIIAALLYLVAILFSLLAVLILILHALAFPMLLPALMIEGTDAYDAVQRCYAYVLARPLHLLLHGALLLILGAVSIGLFALVARGGDQLAAWSASQFTTDAGLEVITGNGELTATQPSAHAIIAFYRSLRDLVISGFAISYFFCAGTVLYLVARRICDGQDVNDLWDPTNA